MKRTTYMTFKSLICLVLAVFCMVSALLIASGVGTVNANTDNTDNADDIIIDLEQYGGIQALSDNSNGIPDPQINGDYVDFQGVKVEKDSTLDAYYMDINFKDHNKNTIGTFYVKGVRVDGVTYTPPSGTREYSLLCRFNRLKLQMNERDNDGNIILDNNGKPKTREYTLRIQINVKVSVFDGFTSSKITFAENVTINLSNNVYKWLKLLETNDKENKTKTLNFNDMSILFTWYNNGKEHGSQVVRYYGYGEWSKFNFKVDLDTKTVPVGVVDPSSPLFDILFGTTGDIFAPDDAQLPEPSESVNFWKWLLDTLMGKNGTFLQVLVWVLVIIAFIVALALFRWVLGFLGFGK